MESAITIEPNHFNHVRIGLSILVGLTLVRVLSGLARFVQHPKRFAVYCVHILWAFSMLILLMHIWWWEFALGQVQEWHFPTFAFIV